MNNPLKNQRIFLYVRTLRSCVVKTHRFGYLLTLPRRGCFAIRSTAEICSARGITQCQMLYPPQSRREGALLHVSPPSSPEEGFDGQKRTETDTFYETITVFMQHRWK
jgi:hypothetical protein